MYRDDEKKTKFSVQLRNGFSDRNGIGIISTEIQYRTLNKRTRTTLINTTIKFLKKWIEGKSYETQTFFKNLYQEVYAQEVDPEEFISEEDVLEVIKNTIREDSYDNVFSLLEFLAENLEFEEVKCNLSTFYNYDFRREYVGYRFVGKQIIEITDENEICAINDSLSDANDDVKKHISKAIKLLSNRDNPDYENSIKESISAVEAMCNIITGKKSTLGDALKKLENNGVAIHGALKSAFNILYGYTSDAPGIRHAGDIGGIKSTFDEAKFMLVACCAFTNYLLSIYSGHNK